MQNYVGQSMALHTRYPGHNGHQPQPGSPLGRVVDIVNQVPPAQAPLRADNPGNRMLCSLALMYICRGPGHILHIAAKAARQPMKRSGCSTSDELLLSSVYACRYLGAATAQHACQGQQYQ